MQSGEGGQFVLFVVAAFRDSHCKASVCYEIQISCKAMQRYQRLILSLRLEMRTSTAISVCTQGRAILNLKLEVLQGMCIPTDEGLVDLSSDCLVAMSAITFHSGTQSNTDQHHVGSFLRTSPCSSRIAHLQLCRALLVKDKHKPESPSFFQTQLVSC